MPILILILPLSSQSPNRHAALAGCSIYCSRTFGTLFWNDSYLHSKSYNDLMLFVYLSMLLQRFYSLILPNPDVQIAYNKYMSKYSG